MVIYSIKDIEEITGIKAHTLRIWEKRYDIIKPHRTKTNIRYYTEQELKEILNISFLKENGFKISQIAEMDPELIKEEIAKLSQVDNNVANQLDALTIAMINMDEKSINIILDKYIYNQGFEQTLEVLINPFLEKLSLLWMAGTLKDVHESFISEILKQRTIIEYYKLPDPPKKGKSILLYLAEGEKQQLSILIFQFLLKSKGINARLAGFDLSLKDILDAYHIINPDFVYTIVNEELKDETFSTYLEYISKSIFPAKFILSGFKSLSVSKIPENVIISNDIQSTIDKIISA